jgi:hypothetical protein
MSDCTNDRTGQIPLIDGIGLYPENPERPGLPNNIPPADYLTRGIEAAKLIRRLDKFGQPANDGRIVFLSASMSNGKREFARFMKLARGQYSRAVSLVNGAQGGYDALRISDPASDYWTKIKSLLASRGLSEQQVQVIWLKQAVAGETDPFPNHALELMGYLEKIIAIAKVRYPNLREVFVSSRTYGGYASKQTSPEPWAYQGGQAVKWLVERHIMESADSKAAGAVASPWVAWGSYLWADGMNPRSDGLIWECKDTEIDGTHPSASGTLKVAKMLLDFFKTNPATEWFNGAQTTTTPTGRKTASKPRTAGR